MTTPQPSLRWTIFLLCLPLLVGVVAAAANVPIGSLQAPESYAVIIGINDYIHYGDTVGGDLRGAEHDARSLHEVLTAKWKVPDDHILMLLNQDATRTAIRSAILDWLPARITSRDRVLFYFAGHGGQVLDQDGDEADGLDETICPTDALPYTASEDIRDDDLRRWLQSLITEDVIVILDSCHSGTGSRFGASGYARSRAIARPNPTAPNRGGAGSGDKSAMADGAAGIIELAATRSDEYAMDMAFVDDEGNLLFYGGMFTTHMIQQLWEAPVDASYERVYWATVTSMKGMQAGQNPQRSGPVRQPFLGGARPSGSDEAGQVAQVGFEAGSPHVLGNLDGSEFQLTLGPLHSIVEGALLVTTRGAVLEVVGGGGDRARAIVRRGDPMPGQAFRITSIPLRQVALHMTTADLPENADRRLREIVNSRPDVILQGSGQSADLLLRWNEEAGTYTLHGIDGTVRAVWSDRSGQLSGHQLLEALDRELEFRRIADLENPGSRFRVEIEFPNGNEFRVGEGIELRVASEERGFLTLLDLSPDGGLTLLYPNEWSRTAGIEPDQPVVIPGPRQGFSLEATPPTGTGLVKAIVTEKPLVVPTVAGGLSTSAVIPELARLIRDGVRDGLEPEVRAQGNRLVLPTRGWSVSSAVYRITDPDDD